MLPRALLSALLLGACEDALEKPAVPDASLVLASFAQPSGSLGTLSPEERSQLLAEPLAGLRLLCGYGALQSCADAGSCQRCRMTEAVSRALGKFADAVGEPDARDAGTPLPQVSGASGFVEVHTICDGWQAPSPDPAHGRYTVDIAFTGRGVDPTGSGRFEQCELMLDDRAVRANGRLLYTFAPEPYVPFERVATQPIVIAFEGTLFTRDDQQTRALKAAFRSASEELSFELPGFGSFVAQFSSEGVEVRGRDQRLRCTSEERVCEVRSSR